MGMLILPGKSAVDLESWSWLFLKKTGTGDMNVLGRALGIPVVTYGPGNSHQSHTRRECVEIQDYLASIDVISEALVNLAQFSSNQNH